MALSDEPAGAAGPGAAESLEGAGETGGTVDWGLAQRVARWALLRHQSPDGYRPEELEADFAELTGEAETLVFEATGLRAPSGARARVIDRPGWVDVNVASIQRLVGPALAKLEARRPPPPKIPVLEGLPWPGGRVPRPLHDAGRALSGAQVGAVLAWLSTRVLGQYDLLLAEEATDDQDLVYFVGPNVAAVEARYGFAERPFRLWLALHEVTHRCQFTAVPWLRDYFVSLVDEGLAPLTGGPERILEGLRRAAEEVRAGRNPLEGAGVLGLVATPEQLAAVERIQALMSLLEGHGDTTMDRAGEAAVPGADRFARVLRERRQQVKGPARLLQQLIGLEAKFRQYEEGEAFIRAVEDEGGADLFNRVWQGPEWLPSLAEIRAPRDWVARVRAVPVA